MSEFITEKEIRTQHLALLDTLAYMQEKKEEICQFFARCHGRKIVFMGCGSSNMLAKSARALFESCPGTAAMSIAGGEYLVCPESYNELLQDSILVLLSRSGMTSEILRAVEMIGKETNAVLVSVTMKEDNALCPLCRLNLSMPWAYDHSVCQTRTVTNLYTCVLLLKAFYAQDKGLEQSVSAAICGFESYMNDHLVEFRALGQKDFDRAIVLADGVLGGLAEEAALAFTEIAMLPGAHFCVLDYRHGPIVLHGEKTMTLVVLQPAAHRYQQDMLEDLKKTGCHLVTIGASPEEIGTTASFPINGSVILSYAAYGIYFIAAAQNIAFEKALERGVNPDQPKGLDAYITLK